MFNNKILTSARNGELIMWDLNKSGVTKYGVYPLSFLSLKAEHIHRTTNEGSHSLYPQDIRVTGRSPLLHHWLSRWPYARLGRSSDHLNCSAFMNISTQGSSRYVKIHYARPPPNLCSKPCIFSELLAAITIGCRSR